MTIQVTLHPASMWECPHCHSTNFSQGVPAEVTNAEAVEYANHFGGKPRDYQNGDWFTVEEEVTCSKCDKCYPVGANWFDGYGKA